MNHAAARYKETIGRTECSLREFVDAADDVCSNFESIMRSEFEAKLEEERLYTEQLLEERCFPDDTPETKFGKQKSLDPQGLITEHGINIQMAMFIEAMRLQRDDYKRCYLMMYAGTLTNLTNLRRTGDFPTYSDWLLRYFEGTRDEFHVRVASMLAELSLEARTMLDEEGSSIASVERAWTDRLAARNRQGGRAHF